jgi:hypothetical protein
MHYGNLIPVCSDILKTSMSNFIINVLQGSPFFIQSTDLLIPNYSLSKTSNKYRFKYKLTKTRIYISSCAKVG